MSIHTNAKVHITKYGLESIALKKEGEKQEEQGEEE